MDNPEITVTRQCSLLSISKAAFYYKPKLISKKQKTLLDRIDEIYTKSPFFGARKIVVVLAISCGIFVGRRKVTTAMKTLGLQAIMPTRKFCDGVSKTGIGVVYKPVS